MIKESTKQIIQRTMQSSFDKENFLYFTKNLLNHIDESKAQPFGGYVKHQFKKATGIVKTYERLGTYTDPNEKKIDILVVYLEKDNSIDRARTSLRNFVADYLKGRGQKDAALVAFVSPKRDDWRFSLIKMEYKIEEGKSGKIKVKEEFTPARRWSFLVGSKESSHTAQSRLAPILEDDDNDPTLEQLEDAFSIEKVTKEFFEKYRELFLGLKDNLDEMIKNDPKIKADFVKKDVDTVDFAKKLLGQIVFLYFLQKKGWFGVERDANWGTGPKDFLRQLYNKKHSEYKNFFNEILEPMFYEALARERDDDYYGSFNCKIPFLNGGLFDPIGNYDWVHTDINLDNELFSNSRPTKQGDIGDGILDIFDRYNFTVREDEPLEKEVAVDPEMLGKVFENLLEVKDRKSKGTYYTPREIVHYMCEQSLINYLVSETGTKKDTFDHLIQLEQFMAQKLPRDEKLKALAMWEGEVKKIEKALDDIKIVDPACGSGAFLIGMMQEIVELRKIIKLFYKTNELTDYEFKSAIIQNNLYGVDIDPGAVEIAKLRLWLSLVVDEDDIKQIKPLPNLDYKIMQGNSLLEEFEGIKLFDESIIPQDHMYRDIQIINANEKVNALQKEFLNLHSNNELSKSQEHLIKQQIKDQQRLIQSLQEKPKQDGTVDLFNQIDEIKAKWDELTELHKKIVNESNRQEKKQMLDRASDLEWQFIEASLRKEGKLASLNKIEKYKKLNTKPFFLWHLHFADVFQSKVGFDVVIANPPYIGEKGHKEMFREVKKGFLGNFYQGKMDLFYFFFHLALNIAKQHSNVAFITTNYYPTATGGRKLREDFKNRANISRLINFNDLKIFESATGQHNMITILLKEVENEVLAETCMTKKYGIAKPETIQAILDWKEEETSYFKTTQKDLYDGEECYIRLTGSTKNSDDPTQRILEKMKQGVRLDSFCNINSGADITISRITGKHLEKFEGNFKYMDGVFVLTENEVEDLRLEGNEHKLLKQFIKNSDIFAFGVKTTTDKLLYLKWGDRIDEVPNIKKHLLRFEEILKDQQERYGEDYPWFALHRPREQRMFEANEKILVPYRSNRNIFGYTTFPLYSSRDIFYITKNSNDMSLKYILSLLNSKLFYIWLYNRGKRKGETLELYQQPISEIPIKKIQPEDQKPFIEIVDKILDITKLDDYLTSPTKQAEVHELESQIDQMVYKLYGLTNDEIKTIEREKK